MNWRKLLPPHLLLLCAAGATALHALAPLWRWSAPATAGPAWSWLAFPVGALGVFVAVSGRLRFKYARTNVTTFGTPGVFVTDGPFRFTRNPMYLGFTLALLGWVLLFGSLSPLFGVLLFVAVSDRVYIAFEERALVATFGAEYERYRACTPRWLGLSRRGSRPA